MHLKLYHWYFKVPKDDTPLHKEQNKRAADPMYEWSNVGGPSRATDAWQAEGQIRPPKQQ